ncbi:MAG TPA: hypothetical protein VNX68_15145 [Nitrosopumilaceae archaeon]|jgi:hypothetical protein|nr:hypothetical protein [Nitrosopumilaceae archaeon]
MATSTNEVLIDNTPLAVTGSGVAGTPGADVFSVQGITGGTPLPVSPGSVSTATVTRVAVSTTVATLLSARPARQAAVIFNEAGILFVLAGAGATATNYTWRLTANAELDISGYTGVVSAIKSAGASSAQVSDF